MQKNENISYDYFVHKYRHLKACESFWISDYEQDTEPVPVHCESLWSWT